ncbi:Coelichelin uptake porter, ABC transporter, extracellular substrate binding protein CchF [Bifidobacterium aquikefiri]|uniref:Coelichelin uptake porter, ABC transporter, extracellular substrate binding protein CchF n=2 Tax=Bifidobacterium aquikefiri TaxID=1653207 RepID=A0A261GBS4_9BIFI|nr:Coelichelin uptake porter, ABC transporter, extracellular substrate binding protein CchF [Bifidobacterium aquikefiri]
MSLADQAHFTGNSCEETEMNHYDSTVKPGRMNRATRSSRLIMAGIMALGLGLTAACGSAGNALSSSDSGSTSGYPVTIRNAYGSVTLKSKPTRISTVGWTTYDAVLSLGVIPVDMPKMSDGDAQNGMYSWTSAKLKELGGTGSKAPKLHDESDSIDTEAIASSNPDLIVATQSGITKQQYQTLSKIAPTLAYPKEAWATPWRDVVTIAAKALNMQNKGKQVLANDEAAIKKAVDAKPNIKGKTAAVMYFDTTKLSTVSVYTTLDTRPEFLNDLGLKTPASVKKISASTKSFYKDISSENVDELNDVDIIVTYGDSSTLKTLQADPLIGKIPAVKRGSVVVIDTNSALESAIAPSSLSIPATVDQYVGLLSKAADTI